jgi:hypothetical protein
LSTDESLTRAEELLARVEAARAELEHVSAGEGGSPERAIELLRELSELAKAVEEELTRAERASLEAPPAKPAPPGGEDRPPSAGPGSADADADAQS